MDRTERFYRIDRLLRSRRRTPMQRLLDEFEVRRATIVRDIQYLRDQRPPRLDECTVVRLIDADTSIVH